MIIKGKVFVEFSQLILTENVWKLVWKICMWISNYLRHCWVDPHSSVKVALFGS